MFKEKLGRFVKQRTAGQLGAPADFNQPAFHEILQDTFDGNAAYGFDIRTSDRLAISDDGKGLERRGRKAGRFRSGTKVADPARAIGMTDQLPALCFLHELKAARCQSVIGFQLAKSSRDFRFFDAAEFICNELFVVSGAGQRIA